MAGNINRLAFNFSLITDDNKSCDHNFHIRQYVCFFFLNLQNANLTIHVSFAICDNQNLLDLYSLELVSHPLHVHVADTSRVIPIPYYENKASTIIIAITNNE